MLTESGGEGEAKLGESISVKLTIVTGIASDGEMDDSNDSSVVIVAVLTTAVIPESDELIDPM